MKKCGHPLRFDPSTDDSDVVSCTMFKILRYRSLLRGRSHVVGLAAVDLDRPVQAARAIEKAVKEDGFVGVRIMPWLWDRPPTHETYYPIYLKCVELGVPLCTQVGHTGPARPSDTGRPIPYIDRVALHFPELRIVCGHIGHPWLSEMMSVMWKHDNIYLDTSAYLPKMYGKDLLAYMCSKSGFKKVMFGTNFPQLDLKKCMQQVHELGLPSEIKDRFLTTNAQRVFNLPQRRLAEDRGQSKL
ncbi:conserved hypothetical protein [Perkinsus marinus ATCC 50983]|uniref:Amidohydrolase-related domain-containing protein n=1 Tax=Perkinsus marinus (strain ATCC 50983 / TXsc) TaxID=423536 RepID=C5L2V4_PERM5|nr:conserved hypothetical protein [Perkinsus marinus ATCC 50983]EER08927.1 conserved hypothetical protein [Perkinsus marinus ATCC 50983]|eukprot:XP_002777111.1 conserved hypothetical protein [Perkinsus marinus ATCC 50983]